LNSVQKLLKYMSKLQVLLVGTGGLGSKIAIAILKKANAHLRILARNKSKVQDLADKGAEIVEGDLNNYFSLLNACKGIDTVISAVQGGPDVIVNGQLLLLVAAKTAGVKRFIPSDYSLDYTNVPPTENPNGAMRRLVNDAVKKSGIEYTSILGGCFMELIFSPFFQIINSAENTINVWGNGDEPIDFTFTDDYATMTAEAIFDPAAINSKFEITSEVTSFNKIIRDYEEVTGKKIIVKNLGTVEDLKAWIDKHKDPNNILVTLASEYKHNMLSQKGKLNNLVNSRYSQVKFTSVKDFIKKSLNL